MAEIKQISADKGADRDVHEKDARAEEKPHVSR